MKVSMSSRADNKTDVLPGVTTDDEGKPIQIVQLKTFKKNLLVAARTQISPEPTEVISDPDEISRLKENGKLINEMSFALNPNETMDSFLNRTKTTIGKS